MNPKRERSDLSTRAVGWAALIVLAVGFAACSGKGGAASDTSDEAQTSQDLSDSTGDIEQDQSEEVSTDTDVDTASTDLVEEPPCGLERVREDLEIPTLDGYALSAFLDRPAQAGCVLPTVLIQTPYNKESAWTSFFGEERPQRPLFNSPHYNFVVVDWRGSWGSKDLPHPGDGPWMAQDSYDTVEWIAAQPWSDGEVGTWGVSALCGAQFRTASGPKNNATHPDFQDAPPPHLSAMVPIMCAMRTHYDGAYPGGVFRHEWATSLDVLGFGVRGIYENNPRKNWLWDLLDDSNPADRIQVPALVVSGWWDLAPRETVAAFNELVTSSDPSVRDQHRLLIGPWIHFAAGGSVGEGAVRPLTEEERVFMDFDRVIDRDSLAFFDFHLRGIENTAAAWAPVRYHHENGSWESALQWPPASLTTTRLYLEAGGTLVGAAPSSGASTLTSDPSDPSPTLGGSTLSPYNCVGSPTPLVCTLTPDTSLLLRHGPMSQAPLLSRADTLLFSTAPLSEAMVLLGEMRLHVDASTTGADADVAVRIVDLDETGDPWLIGEGIQRLAARDDNRSYSPVAAAERVSLVVQVFKDFAYTVPAGHRLGIMVSGANWPLFARNPQDGAVFYEGDAHPSTNTTFSYGLPPTQVDLKGAGEVADLTFYLDGATFLEISGAP